MRSMVYAGLDNAVARSSRATFFARMHARADRSLTCLRYTPFG